MMDLELSDWLSLTVPVLLVIVALLALKALYTSKAFEPLPATKPRLCLLPKYLVSLSLEGADLEGDLLSHLAVYGFREVQRNANAIVLSRGSALGDLSFSVEIAKLNVTVSLPVAAPAQLKVQYGVAFGCALDTGDLWKVCRELTDVIENTPVPQGSDHTETDNPYQSPPH